MRTLVFLLEEPSAKALLEGFLAERLPGGWTVRYVVFEGKQDLEKNVARRIQGWRDRESRFVVLCDQDAGACAEVKNRFASLIAGSSREAMVRIACRELEAWVLGDLSALAGGYSRPKLIELATKAKYRDPDALANPVQEIRRLVPEYQKVDGARRVGPLLNPDRSNSASFRAFCAGLDRLWRGA